MEMEKDVLDCLKCWANYEHEAEKKEKDWIIPRNLKSIIDGTIGLMHETTVLASYRKPNREKDKVFLEDIITTLRALSHLIGEMPLKDLLPPKLGGI